MAAKKKKKAATKKAAKKKSASAKKKGSAKKKAPAKKKTAPKKKTPAKKKKKKASKRSQAYAIPRKAAATLSAPAYEAVEERAESRSSGNGVDMYKGPNLSHHPVSVRQMDEIASEGLRSDGEIVHVEEKDFAPCRLVDHGEGRFSLCFDDFRMPKLAIFDERGLQGGGYTWEAVVDALVRTRRPDLLGELSYDSEAGMFVAIGSRDALKDVAELIQEAIADPATMQAALDSADPDRLE